MEVGSGFFFKMWFDVFLLIMSDGLLRLLLVICGKIELFVICKFFILMIWYFGFIIVIGLFFDFMW